MTKQFLSNEQAGILAGVIAARLDEVASAAKNDANGAVNIATDAKNAADSATETATEAKNAAITAQDILSQLETDIATQLKEVADKEKADFAAAQAYTDSQIAGLVGGAPEQLDTLKELADAFTDDASLIEALNNAVANHVHSVATASSNGFMSADMVKTLNSASTMAQDTATDLRNFSNTVNNRIDSHETAVTDLQSRVTTLESRCDTLENVLTYFMPATNAAVWDETETK